MAYIVHVRRAHVDTDECHADIFPGGVFQGEIGAHVILAENRCTSFIGRAVSQHSVDDLVISLRANIARAVLVFDIRRNARVAGKECNEAVTAATESVDDLRILVHIMVAFVKNVVSDFPIPRIKGIHVVDHDA